MENRKRIRLDTAPLNIAVSLGVATGSSPLTQIYDGEYNPDRELTPTVIVPQVTLYAEQTEYNNSRLAQMVWYVNGTDISTLSDWSGEYEITTDGDEKGAITIYKNLSVGEMASLRFEAVVNDTVSGYNYPIASDEVILTTIELASVSYYTLDFGHDTTISYDPVKDLYFEYEYKASHGATVTGSQDDYKDSNEYRLEIPLTLRYAKETYSGTWSVRVYTVTWSGSEMNTTEITDTDDSEFEEISTDKLVMNLLMVDKQEYVVKAFVDSTEVASMQFAVRRKRRPYNVKSLNGASRKKSDIYRHDKASITSCGKILEYGESIIKIIWKTDSYYKTNVTHGEGKSITYRIEDTGAGSDYSDGYIEQYFETSYKDIHTVATDESDNTYTDDSDNTLIFN